MLLSELMTSPLTLGLLGLATSLILVLAVLLVGQRRRYRALLVSPGTPGQAGIVRVDHAGWHPDRRSDLEDKLATLTEQHTRLEEAHTILLARHKALIREFQRRQTETPVRAHPVTQRKVRAKA